jgi:L-lactate utilization protein LutB
MGIVLIQTDLESLEKIYTPVVKAILDFEAGKVKKLQRCGLCDWCRGTCKVEIPTREMMPTIRYKL